MREIEKCEYVYDGISYYIPKPIAEVLSELECEASSWRKKWQVQHDVHSKEIDYWIARCKKSDDLYSALAEDWKLLLQENNDLRAELITVLGQEEDIDG